MTSPQLADALERKGNCPPAALNELRRMAESDAAEGLRSLQVIFGEKAAVCEASASIVHQAGFAGRGNPHTNNPT